MKALIGIMTVLLSSGVAAAQGVEVIRVVIDTADGAFTSTDDWVYLGFAGPGGGREFNLDRRRVNDFQPGKTYSAALGDPNTDLKWVRSGAVRELRLDLDSIRLPYLRKHIHPTRADDDLWKIDTVTIDFIGPASAEEGPACRRFILPATPMTLSAKHGGVVYLREVPDCEAVQHCSNSNRGAATSATAPGIGRR